MTRRLRTRNQKPGGQAHLEICAPVSPRAFLRTYCHVVRGAEAGNVNRHRRLTNGWQSPRKELRPQAACQVRGSRRGKEGMLDACGVPQRTV